MDFGGTSRYGSFFKKLPYRIIFLSMQKATVPYDMYPPVTFWPILEMSKATVPYLGVTNTVAFEKLPYPPVTGG